MPDGHGLEYQSFPPEELAFANPLRDKGRDEKLHAQLRRYNSLGC